MSWINNLNNFFQKLIQMAKGISAMPDLPPSPNAPSVESLLDSLRAVYEGRNRLEEFNKEKEVFDDLIPKIIKTLSPLLLVRAFGLGSTATVWEVVDERLNQKRALKLPRPRYGKIDKIIRVITAEKDTLASLTHQHIIKIYLSGEIETVVSGQQYSFPYFLMEYLDGVKDIDEYILHNYDSLTGENVISYFRNIAQGLLFLHEKEVIHCDIKPGNIIIAPNSPALIADLGYAKHFDRIPKDDQDRMTTVTYTPLYAHPELRNEMVRFTDEDANVAVIQRNELRPAFDLYAFGKTLQTILKKISDKERSERRGSIFTPYQWRYLALIAVRLLDGEGQRRDEDDALESDVIPGLPFKIMKELKYSIADHALEDFEKLLNLYDLEGEIPELNSNLSNYIQIPGSQVPFTKRVKRIINHSSFVRLNQVSQLGFVSLLYPGATHTRAEHSLGAFEKCCQMIRSLWYDENSCIFRSIMSKSDIEGLLLAALLHDIGHYPMAHDLGEVYGCFAHDRYTEALLSTFDPYSGESIADIIHAEWDTKIDVVLSILKADENSSFKMRILKSIISGPLDVDKLDYLLRDSLHVGVTFGRDIDMGRLLRNVTVCFMRNEENIEVAEIGVTEKAISVAESVWRARLEMFRQIYWHHTVRTLKAMLTFVVRRIIIDLLNTSKLEDFVCNLNRYCLYPLGYERNNEKTPSCSGGCGFSVEDSLGIDETLSIPFSHLSHTDDSLITFLWPFADMVGQNVLQMIRRRQLYKRVAVLSDSIEHAYYDSIYTTFREERIRNRPDQQEIRRTNLERAILDKCITDFNEKTFYESNEKIPIVLFDVPLKALRSPSKKESLWYVPEYKLGLSKVDVFKKPPIVESKIQLENTEFDKTVGKIRVLSHPDWEQVIMSKLNNKQIIKLLCS